MAPQFSKILIESLVKESIIEFTVKPGSNPGDNVAGDIYAINIQTISGKNYNLVIKTLPEGNAELREYATSAKVFELEISIYTSLKESLEKLIKSYGISENEYIVPIPAYFGGKCDGENDFLCLEDLRPYGFKMPNKYNGLNYLEVSFIVKELAKFHASTYVLIKYEGESFFNNVKGMEKLVNNFFNDTSPMADFMIDVLFGSALEISKDILTKKNNILGEKLKIGIEKHQVLPIMKYIHNLTDKKIFPVIVHGDFWVNNILIKYDEDGKPIDTKFIDFQQSRRGNIFDDLIYFIFTSTTPHFRTEYLHQILNIYYKTFMATCIQLKTPPPLGFTFGFFLDTFFGCYMSGLVYMTYAVPLQLGVDSDIPANESEIQDIGEKMRRRLARMLGGSSRALDRLESIVQEFVDLNLL